MRKWLTGLILAALSLLFRVGAPAQATDSAPEAVRVTVSLNADGSRTVYEFDTPHHKATATTTAKTGKRVGKIQYGLDEAGRFTSGEVYGPDDRLRFKTLYKYEASGKLTQEIQLGTDDSVQHKIVYAYGTNGKQMGYAVYDAVGKLIRRTGAAPPTATPTPKHGR